MFPQASDTIAITASAYVHRRSSCGKAVTNSRYVTTNAAIFVAEAMNAVTGVGAPW